MDKKCRRAGWLAGIALAFVAGTAGVGRAADKDVRVINGPTEPVPVTVQGTPYMRQISVSATLVDGGEEDCDTLDVPVGKRLVLRHVSGSVSYVGPARPRVMVKALFQLPGGFQHVRIFLQTTNVDEGSATPIPTWEAHLDLLGFQGVTGADGATLTDLEVCISRRVPGDSILSFIGFASGYLEDAN